MAERVGFEPTRPLGLPVFKTGAFNRSAISPDICHAGCLYDSMQDYSDKLEIVECFIIQTPSPCLVFEWRSMQDSNLRTGVSRVRISNPLPYRSANAPFLGILAVDFLLDPVDFLLHERIRCAEKWSVLVHVFYCGSQAVKIFVNV